MPNNSQSDSPPFHMKVDSLNRSVLITDGILMSARAARSFQIRKKGVDINLSHKAEASVPVNIFNCLALMPAFRVFASKTSPLKAGWSAF